MHIYLDRLPLAAIGFPRIFQVSQHFFLLRIDGEGGLAAALLGCHPSGNVLELSVSVRMLFSFPRLAIRQQAVALST